MYRDLPDMDKRPFLSLFVELPVPRERVAIHATQTFTEARENPDRDYSDDSLATKTSTQAREEDDTDISASSPALFDTEVL
jgi:hypothetical protein